VNYYDNIGSQQFMAGRCRGITHRIRRGDTLYKLSKVYGVSVSDIMRANPSNNIYNLQVDERICIPLIGGQFELPTPEVRPPQPESPTPEMMPPKPELPTPEMMPPKPELPTPEMVPPKPELPTPERVPPKNAAPEFLYEVASGDTLNSILKKFNITFEQFAELNPQLMPIPLEEGTGVFVPNTMA